MTYMKKQHLAFAVAAALGLSVLISGAYTNAGVPGSKGYVTNGDGNIVTSGSGGCVQSGSWSETDAVPGCGGVVARAEAAPAPVESPPVETVASAPAVTSESASPRVIAASDALFDTGKSDIKPAGRSVLDELAAQLKDNERKVVSTGHASSPGAEDYNLKLSQRRAEAVKVYLMSKGIESNRIQTYARGESEPVADNATTEGRRLNRRVEIEVVDTSSS